MASKQAYPCFRCRDSGADNVMVLLDGKDEHGKTKYLNEDGTRHQHKQKEDHSQQQQQSQQQQNDVGDVPKLAPQMNLSEMIHILQGLEQKIDHLTKLVYALTEKQGQGQTQK